MIKIIIKKHFKKKLPDELKNQLKELTDQKSQNNSTYCFKSNTARKRFDDFNNDMEPFEKVKPGEMKLEEAKKLQNLFKSNLKRNIKRKV